MMLRAGAIAAAGVLVVVGVLVLRGWDETNGSSPEAAFCRVTIPDGEPPPSSRAASGWHGRGSVRVTLPADGRLVVTAERPPPAGTTAGSIDRDGSMSVKFLWWFSRSAGPRVLITGRLDDGSQTHVLARGRRRLPNYWPSRLRFPGEGCWRVTAQDGRTKLSFVLDVSAAGSRRAVAGTAAARREGVRVRPELRCSPADSRWLQRPGFRSAVGRVSSSAS